MTLSDRGSVTAELAVAMPALMLLFLAGLGGVNGVIIKLRCCDAARDIALAQARGEDSSVAVERYAPDNAAVTISSEIDRVKVVVRAPVQPVGTWMDFAVEGVAVAAIEPTL